MPQLDPTWFASQLFWLVICFGALYLLLSTLVLPSLTNVITSRKGAVDGDIGEAQALKAQAEAAKTLYEATLQKSRETAHALLAQSQAASKARGEEATKALEAQVALKLKEAETAIALKKKALLEVLTPAAVEFSSQIVEKLTQRAPSADQVKRALAAVEPKAGK